MAKILLLCSLVLSLSIGAGQDASELPIRWSVSQAEGLPDLRYAVLLPEDYDPENQDSENADPGRTWPLLLALPPGTQDEKMVRRGLDLYFAQEARRLGWIVVSPIAPEGQLFFEGGEARLPELLDALEQDLKIEGGRVHLAGVSNGGLGAFRIAGLHPERIASLTVAPGFPATDEDRQRLVDLAHLPIAIYVGAEDERWVREGRETLEHLEQLGAPDAALVERPGEGHMLDRSLGSVIFDRLEVLREAERLARTERAAAGVVLDRLHRAAATADEETYFGCFAPGAVFIGTDATERWSLAQFRAYCLPHFEGETAWTYSVNERHVELSRDGSLAWFDERLSNQKYGETRGSGVLVKDDSRWRISQYVLSFAVPNERAAEVVEVIRR